MKEYEQHSIGPDSKQETDEREFKHLEKLSEHPEGLPEPRTLRMLSYLRWKKQFAAAPVLRLIICGFLVSGFGGLAAKAQETFQLLKTYTPVPDCPPAKSFTLVTDDHQVTFIPPEGSVVKPFYEKREVWITYPDDRCLLKLAASTNSAELVKSGATNELRKLVQSRYPDAEVGPATFCHSSCSAGYTFDILEFTQYKTKTITRLAFVPVPDGMLEVSLKSAEAKFPSQQFALSRLLGWMRVERPNPATLSLRKG